MRVLSLFDFTGYMVKPWTEAGHDTLCVDTLFGQEVPAAISPNARHMTEFSELDLSKYGSLKILADWNPDIIFGFPPCTDLAVSGSKHWAGKLARDPNIQKRAIKLARQVEKLGEVTGKPWMIENPVGAMSTQWRAPDYYFEPHNYSGFLPEDDVHPDWPQYIPPRDLYPKKTCIWCGNGFWMPEAQEVKLSLGRTRVSFDVWRKSEQGQRYAETFFRLGGKSLKTKIIRSATPRGFAEAVFQVNSP